MLEYFPVGAVGGPYVEQDSAMHRRRRSSGAACTARSRLRRRWWIASRTCGGPDRSNASGDDFHATVQHARAIPSAYGNANGNAAADGHSDANTVPDTSGCANADAVPNCYAAAHMKVLAPASR